MKRRLRLTLAVVVAVALMVSTASAVIAAYAATITVTNSGTAITRASVNTSMNVNYLVANGYITANGTDTRVDLAGTEYPHLLAEDRLVFAGPVPSGSTDYTFSTGSVLQDFTNTFGYNGYVTQADNATLEYGDNFTATVDGYINTANGTNKNIILKAGSVNVSIGQYNSGNITARIGTNATTRWTSPSGFGYYGIWANVPNAYDDNTGTQASWTTPAPGLSNFVYYTTNMSNPVRGFRIWPDRSAANINNVRVDLYFNGGWQTVINTGTPAWNTWNVIDLGYDATCNGTRIQFTSNLIGAIAYINEIDFLEDIPQQVTRTGVATGEHEITVQMDSPFLSIAEDYGSTPITPVGPSGANYTLILNDPLWQYDQGEPSGSTFASIDSFGVTNTVSGAVWTYDNGYAFDGADDYIEITHDASQLLTMGGTIEAWIKPITVGEVIGYIIDKTNGFVIGYTFGTYAGNTVAVNINNGVWVPSAAGSVVFGSGNWYHVAVTWLANGWCTLYVNGAQSGVPATSGDPGQILSVDNPRIGNRAGATDRSFNGTIGEIRIYNATLTDAEILQNYEATKDKYLGTGDINTYSTLASAPDNANDWTYMNNGGGTPNWIPYTSNISIKIGGNQRVLFPGPNNYIRNTVLVNEASAGEPGVIHWGTNPATITINNGGFAVGATALEGEELTTPDVAGIINQAQSQFYEDVPNTPITGIIADIAGLTSVPQLVLWYFLMLVFAMAFFVKVHQWTGNLLVAGAVFLAVVGAFVGIGAVPMWVPLVGILLLISITALEARA